MLRKRKKFDRPRTLFDKPRILAENKLVGTYGLKNKKEIWKTEAKINYFRSRAKILATSDEAAQQHFLGTLNTIGLQVQSIADVLSLQTEDLLKRRLPSVLVAKNLASTAKTARQMVVHKRVLLNGRVVNIPGYIVRVEEEDTITIRKKVRKPKVADAPAESEAPEAEEAGAGVPAESAAEEQKPVEVTA